MNKLYSSPWRVYFCFAALMTLGGLAYLNLPVSLFPNSAKPFVGVYMPFGALPREAFIATYGKVLEAELQSIRVKGCQLEEITSSYESNRADYDLFFHWDDDPDTCLKEVTRIVDAFKSRFPEGIRNEVSTYLSRRGTGFFYGTFHSDQLRAEELYNLIEPILQPKLSAIHETDKPEVFNPSGKQITIELLPLKMAAFKLLPRDVFGLVRERLATYSGGSFNENGNHIAIEISAQTSDVQSLERILVSKDPKKQVYLSQIAEIKLEDNNQFKVIFKLNGASSVAIFISPGPGKNIKNMCDKILVAVHESIAATPASAAVKFSVVINPAEYIDSAISNVMREVWLCSLIAVLVLLLFIGSFFGTLTALIEIPTSLILSFILMKWTGVHLNLISLGGLALSVGMNVDASIVIIDAIIKKFNAKNTQKSSYTELVAVVVEAVRSVYVPVIVSTVTSLIVFVPLVFTSELTNALLGDLAKAVLYSHALSLGIALILVPTIRLHLAYKFQWFSEEHSIGWLDAALNKLYAFYAYSLGLFLTAKKVRLAAYLCLTVLLLSLLAYIPPRLKKEIIGKPDTSILTVDLSSRTNTQMSEMEEGVSRFERLVNEKFPDMITFSFAQIYAPGGAFVGMHLSDKTQFQTLFKGLKALTKNDGDLSYDFGSFNPTELPIPNPPDWRIAFKGKSVEEVQNLEDYFKTELLEADLVSDVKEDTNDVFANKLYLKPYDDRWSFIKAAGVGLAQSDLADILSLATRPLELGKISQNNRFLPIVAKYPDQLLTARSDLAALPLALGEQIVPLRALVEFREAKQPPRWVRKDGEPLVELSGYFSEEEKKRESEVYSGLEGLLERFRKNILPTLGVGASVELVDAKVELTTALRELSLAVAVSLGLIFLVLFFQFGSVVHTLIIMLAIPFGVLGVLVSLYVFDSTLSLNSALGIILLVGITVANSIMLVELILKLVRAGMTPEQAVLETAKERIRPILMTSLTTILGMLPIAIGYGEGGKILQPLGIAVCGGLWISLIFTLYLIPALECSYLKKQGLRGDIWK